MFFHCSSLNQSIFQLLAAYRQRKLSVNVFHSIAARSSNCGFSCASSQGRGSNAWFHSRSRKMTPSKGFFSMLRMSFRTWSG